MDAGPDYTRYSLPELLDVQERIDRDSYPERAAMVDSEIARRLAKPASSQPQEPIPVQLAAPVAVKPGRVPSLIGAVASIGVGAIGILELLKALDTRDPYKILFMVVFCFIAFSGAFYRLYNVTQRNRFSNYELVQSAQEPDPFARALGYETTPAPRRRFPGEHCPFCGASAPRTVDLCPSCGKDI